MTEASRSMIGDLQRQSVLVTGGTGFIGRRLVDAVVGEGAYFTVLSRHAAPAGGQGCKVITGDLACPATLEGICQDMNIVFHLGGYAHAIDQPDGKSEKINRQVTVDGTRALLEQSIKAGVRRFLFFSSVKAMGEGGGVCRGARAPWWMCAMWFKRRYWPPPIPWLWVRYIS